MQHPLQTISWNSELLHMYCQISQFWNIHLYCEELYRRRKCPYRVRCRIARVMKPYLRIYNSSYGHSQARSKLTTSNAGTNETRCLTSLRSFLKAMWILSAGSTLTWPAARLVHFYRSRRLKYFCRTDIFLSYSISFIHILYNYLSNI